MNNYDRARQARRREHENNSWLQSQGIDPDKLVLCDHAQDLGRLMELKPLWSSVTEQDQSQWFCLWYRVYKRNLSLTETHIMRFRNILKRARRLSRRQ